MGPCSEGTGTANPSAIPTLSPPPPLAGQAWTARAQCPDEQTEAFAVTDKCASSDQTGLSLLPGAAERARPERKPSTLEEELSKFLERQKDQQNDQAELRGQCWPVWPEGAREGDRNSSPDRWRVPGGSSPSWPPWKVAATSFRLQTRPREGEHLVRGITALVGLGLPHSEAHRRPTLRAGRVLPAGEPL